MKPGDIIFVRGKGIISWVIEKVTRSRYSHVALYMGNGEIFEAQRFRRTGPAKLEIYNGEYDAYTVNMSDEQRNIVVEYARKARGIKYDYLDIARLFFKLVFGLHLPYDDPTRIICSELIYNAYKAAGIVLASGEPYDITPEDLVENPILKKVS